MPWRSVAVMMAMTAPALAAPACPTAVQKLVSESIDLFRDRDLRDAVGRIDRDHLQPGTPITGCWAGISYRLRIGGEDYWVRRLGIRTQTAASPPPGTSDKVLPYGAGGRGMFE